MPQDGVSAQPPASTVRLLSEIWTEVLGLQHAEITDNFIDLGGDSITIMRLTARVRDVFNVEISVDEWFRHPTIQLAAAFIDAACSSKHSQKTRL